MRIRACYEPFNMRTALYFTDEKDGFRYRAQPLVFERTQGFTTIEPTVSFEDKSELQSLMDDLWSMGLRPSARSDEYKAQLGTMRDHLNDMRAIVFKKREDL